MFLPWETNDINKREIDFCCSRLIWAFAVGGSRDSANLSYCCSDCLVAENGMNI